MGPLKPYMFPSDLVWVRQRIPWAPRLYMELRPGKGRFRLTHRRPAGEPEGPAADTEGPLAVTGYPVTDNGGPVALTGSPLADGGGTLADTRGPHRHKGDFDLNGKSNGHHR